MSATIRFSSSGMVGSKLRSPASTWPTGMPKLRCGKGGCGGRVDVAGHEHDVGRSETSTGSRRSITRATCTACVAEPTPSKWEGSPSSNSSRKIADSSWS